MLKSSKRNTLSDIYVNQQFFFVVALVSLACAIQTRLGFMSFEALVALMSFVCFFVAAFALYRPLQRCSDEQLNNRALNRQTPELVHGERTLVQLTKVAVLFQLGFFVWVNLQMWVVAVLIGTAILIDTPRFGFSSPKSTVSRLFICWLHWRPLYILALYSAIGLAYIISDMPATHHEDFYYFQQDGARALLSGVNPYEMRLPSVYPPDTPFYGPGLVKDGVLQFGYVYLPLTLLMAIPGFLLGDVRLALFFALLLSGAIIMDLGNERGFLNHLSRTRATQISVLAGSLLLLYPQFVVLLINGWSDNFVILLFCVVVLCATRKSPWLPVAVGLWLASKQYVVLLLPLTLMLLPSQSSPAEKRRFYGIALATALIVSLPMILWNVREFVWSAVQLQFYQPLRDDALSFLVAFKLVTGIILPIWIPFVALILATIWALRVAPRSPHGFCAACTLVFTVFIVLNKQAFMNYYLVIFAMLCCTIATSRNSISSEESSLFMAKPGELCP